MRHRQQNAKRGLSVSACPAGGSIAAPQLSILGLT